MSAQRSFAEMLIDPRMGSNRKLEAIAEVIDWQALQPIACRIRRGEQGRPPYHPLAMLKALVLARMYGLSDPALEEALMERGAASASAYVTHGVLSGGAVARITASPLEKLVITDTIQATEAVRVARNIHQLSVAKLIGEAIRRISDERSVSSLFD